MIRKVFDINFTGNSKNALATPCIWVKSGFQMYWSAGALVALLCGDTVTPSNEDKFPERD